MCVRSLNFALATTTTREAKEEVATTIDRTFLLQHEQQAANCDLISALAAINKSARGL